MFLECWIEMCNIKKCCQDIRSDLVLAIHVYIPHVFVNVH